MQPAKTEKAIREQLQNVFDAGGDADPWNYIESDGLPKPDRDYQCTVVIGDKCFVLQLHFDRDYGWCCENHDTSEMTEIRTLNWTVIAWCELPEPATKR